jgi:hypothetical protein
MEKFRSGIPDPQRCDFPCNVVAIVETEILWLLLKILCSFPFNFDAVVDELKIFSSFPFHVFAVIGELKILCDFPFNIVEELVVNRQGGGGPGAGRGSQQQQPGRGSSKEKR